MGIKKILNVETDASGWGVSIEFHEFKGFLKERDEVTGKKKKDYIQEFVHFPIIPVDADHAHHTIENTVKSFGGIKISGFVKFMPMLTDPEDSMVLRIADNSNYRKWFTGNQSEKVNHHIPEANQDFFMINGKWEKAKDPVLDVAIKRLMAIAKEEGLTDEEFVELKKLKEKMKEARGERLPLETTFDKNYIFRKNQWIPEVVVRYQLEQKKAEKDAIDAVDYDLIHNDLKHAVTAEDINAVFLRHTVVTGEGDDLDLKKYKHEKWEAKNKKQPKVIVIPVAAGSSTMNYSPTSYKIKHYQVPSKNSGGKRPWKGMVTRMKVRGELTEFQEEMAQRLLQVA